MGTSVSPCEEEEEEEDEGPPPMSFLLRLRGLRAVVGAGGRALLLFVLLIPTQTQCRVRYQIDGFRPVKTF